MWACLTELPYLFGVIVHHAGGVVNSQTDLVLSLAGLGPPQPDLVFAELTGDVGDHLPHVQTLPCAVIASVGQRNITRTFNILSVKIYQHNTWNTERVGSDLSLAACVGSRMRRSCSHSCWERAEVRLWYWCHMEAAALSYNTERNSLSPVQSKDSQQTTWKLETACYEPDCDVQKPVS